MDSPNTPKALKIKVRDDLLARIISALSTLKERGARDITMAEVIETHLLSLDEEKLKAIVEDHTPFEYKLKLAMFDEKKKKQIMKILSSRDEGSNGELSR